MSIKTGDRIGPYEVTGKLGAGGMGEVYAAKDTKLNRSVAIKVLPAALARDADYVARFQREAQALAALNHPHIATIYGLEDSAIVMELVEGKTLAEFDSIPVDDAIEYARQIAEALEAAHEKGITHRDLKPANIKVTPEGSIKVLDFGLAKVRPAVSASPDESPTLTLRATQSGVIVGTAGYMSPEQAAGKEVDRRADIWSFGVVLYEMLTGKRLFTGESISHILAAVLQSPIDFTALPAATPAPVRELLRRCLDRKLRARLQWIGEARAIMEAPPASAIVETAPPRSPKAWIAAAGIAAIAAVGSAAWAWNASRKPEPEVLRFFDSVGEKFTLMDRGWGPSALTGPTAVISPDGKRFVFVTKSENGRSQLMTRRLDQSESAVIPGTEDAEGPFFSPNSQSVGFFSGQKLKKVRLDGSRPIDIGSVLRPLSAFWAEDGFIYGNLSYLSPLQRVSEAGGTLEPVSKLDPGDSTHRWVQVLARERVIVYAAGIGGSMDQGRIVAQRLDGGEKMVVRNGAMFPRLLPDGKLLFVSGGVAYAAPFDPRKLELTGEPVQVLQNFRHANDSGGAQLSISNNGTLIYRAAGKQGGGPKFHWLWPDGKYEPFAPAGVSGLTGSPHLSPDDRRVLFRAESGGQTALWIHDLASKQTMRLTFENEMPIAPVWAPDGKHIYYSTRSGLFRVASNGSGKPEKLLDGGNNPLWVSRDGKRLGFDSSASAGTKPNPCSSAMIVERPNTVVLEKSEPCFPSDGAITPYTDLSVDGRWIAYTSTESGEMQIQVRHFPDNGGKWQISTTGGTGPQWSQDGKRLFYLSILTRELMSVSVDTSGETFRYGVPTPWTVAKLIIGSSSYTANRDGSRMLAMADPGTAADADPNIAVILNFPALIRRLANSDAAMER
ncbi:MAG: protein kinase domain-containing protein [Bryobacteraceae bacterium]